MSNNGTPRRLVFTANVMKIMDLLAVNQDKWLEGPGMAQTLEMNYWTSNNVLMRLREFGYAVDRKADKGPTLLWQITREGFAIYNLYKGDMLFDDPDSQRASVAARNEVRDGILALPSDAAGLRFAVGKLARAAERFPEVAGVQEALSVIAKRMTSTSALFEQPPTWVVEYYDADNAEWCKATKPFTESEAAVKYLSTSVKFKGKQYRVLRYEGEVYLEDTGVFGEGSDSIE